MGNRIAGVGAKVFKPKALFSYRCQSAANMILAGASFHVQEKDVFTQSGAGGAGFNAYQVYVCVDKFL